MIRVRFMLKRRIWTDIVKIVPNLEARLAAMDLGPDECWRLILDKSRWLDRIPYESVSHADYHPWGNSLLFPTDDMVVPRMEESIAVKSAVSAGYRLN